MPLISIFRRHDFPIGVLSWFSGTPHHALSREGFFFGLLGSVVLGFVGLALTPTPATAMPPECDDPSRVSLIEYDFDNNGTPDATTSTQYNGVGELIGTTYTYTDDGTPDIFVTQDDEASIETGVFSYNGANRLAASAIDRTNFDLSTESFDLDIAFLGGLVDRQDSTNQMGATVDETYATFDYVAGVPSDLEVRNTLDDSLVFTITFDYAGTDRPVESVFLSSFAFMGMVFTTTTTTQMNWRADGQIDDLSSATVVNGTPADGGSADFFYDANGKLLSEVWTRAAGAVTGASSTEFPGEDYTKTTSYDSCGRKVGESVDLDSDGSVEATLSFVLETGPCFEPIFWAPNGRPNFIQEPGGPYFVGTGFESLEACPEPSFGLSLLLASGFLARFGRRRRV